MIYVIFQVLARLMLKFYTFLLQILIPVVYTFAYERENDVTLFIGANVTFGFTPSLAQTEITLSPEMIDATSALIPPQTKSDYVLVKIS
jgi:hypothetical protein